MANEDEGARLTRREENRELIAKHRATIEPKGCPTPGACSAVADLADLKQRILPQFQGRAQRAEHERDALLEQLIAARSATAAPPVEVGAPDRPDWARQLPGAELYDRAARYEYIRTLNPRKFAALYNEALMGVHQFDDLVDRRMKGEPVDHGYDRSASLNSSRYVCTCGACTSAPLREGSD